MTQSMVLCSGSLSPGQSACPVPLEISDRQNCYGASGFGPRNQSIQASAEQGQRREKQTGGVSVVWSESLVRNWKLGSTGGISRTRCGCRQSAQVSVFLVR